MIIGSVSNSYDLAMRFDLSDTTRRLSNCGPVSASALCDHVSVDSLPTEFRTFPLVHRHRQSPIVIVCLLRPLCPSLLELSTRD